MNTFKNWSEVFTASLHNLWLQFVEAIPMVLAGLALLLLGWLIARSMKWLSLKFLKAIKFDDLLNRFNLKEVLEKMQVKSGPSKIVAKAVYWTVILVFLVGFAEILGWQIVSEKIAGIIAFIPKLFAGLIIFGVGLYIATLLKKMIVAGGETLGVSSARLLGSIARYVLIVIITLTTLEQIGVNIDLIKSNVIVIVGGVVLAFGIGYGIGSRHVVANILAAFYGKGKFKVGQKAVIDGKEGLIETFDSTSIGIRTSEGRLLIIPASMLAEQTIEILSPPAQG